MRTASSLFASLLFLFLGGCASEVGSPSEVHAREDALGQLVFDWRGGPAQSLTVIDCSECALGGDPKVVWHISAEARSDGLTAPVVFAEPRSSTIRIGAEDDADLPRGRVYVLDVAAADGSADTSAFAW